MFDAEVSDLIQARRLVAGGRLSVRELLEMACQHLQDWESRVHAFVHLDLDAAFEAALHLPEGPLKGMPAGIKDLADVAGMPTTGGSRAYGWVAAEDAPAVRRWRQAGAVILGKTNTQELAFGVITPPTRNPWNLDYIPGGSSGGTAAALAAGMILVGLGSDTGGSIRIPASCCGVVGFKSTYGRIPAEGVMPLSYTCDHVGPLAHTVADVDLLYRVMAGLAARHPLPMGEVVRRRAGVPWEYLEGRVHPAVRAAFEQTLDLFRSAGWEIRPVAMEPWTEWLELQLTLRLPEAYFYHQDVLEGPGRELLGGDLARRLDPGGTMPALSYVAAQRKRLSLQGLWRDRVQDLDVILMPTIPVPVPRVGADTVDLPGGRVTVWEALISLTAPWNVLGWPAISVPMGRLDDGLPTGLQIIAPWGDDDRVLEVAGWFEATHGGIGRPTLS